MKLNKFSRLSTTEKKQIRGGRAIDLIVFWKPNDDTKEEKEKEKEEYND